MKASRNISLFLPYLICSVEGVCHGIYLLWLTVHRGIAPITAAALIGACDLLLLLFELPTGVFADRLGARPSLLLGSAIQMLGLALFWQGRSLPALGLGALAIALGDAFRHGADQALLYRSCAALGEPQTFGRRLASAHAWALVALVGLTTLGGVLAERVSFDLAWALELVLSAIGLVLAWAMVDLPALPDEPDDEDEPEGGGPRALLAGLASRLPWPLLVPAALIGTLAATSELIAQTASPGRLGPSLIGALIASGLLLEALGAALVARGLLPTSARALDLLAFAALAATALVALDERALVPALALIFLGSGAAPAIRGALVQQGARDGERATVASAAGALDMLGKTAGLPLAAALQARGGLKLTAALLSALSLLAWALASRRRAGEHGP